MKFKKKILFFLFFTFLSSSLLYSVAPHISGKYYKNKPKIKPKSLVDVSYLKLKGAPRKEIAKTLGTVGTKKVAVIIVDFESLQFENLKEANTTFNKLKEYYSEVSYGQLQLDITFFYQGGSTKTLTATATPYRMSNSVSYYAQNTQESLSQLVKDAISTSSVRSSDYDYVMVLHAGYGAESLKPPDGHIWSVYVSWDDGPVNGFTDGTIVPEKENNASPIGVICHEFGHQLGLPDLYYQSPDGKQYSIVGSWCLMDYGTWLGNPQGSQPAHLSAWCKDFLSWVDLEIVSSTKRNVQLPYVESSSSIIKIEILTADNPQKEYFLVEYRRKTLFDSSLPGEGVLIWKIDDNIAKNLSRLNMNNINSGDPHYGVDLIEADRTPVEWNYGDSGDPFPGIENVINFLPSDYSLFASNGKIIPVYLTDINHSGIYANFNILDKLEIEGLVRNEVRIGNNYTYGGRLMSIGFNLSEPSEIEILVYNLSGRLVKNFGKMYFSSGEHTIKWYAVDDENKNLSYGLYFLVVKGKNIHKVEKFIIKK
ncbi:MAG: M6 family metalloprotease domain-containing protein [Endomicrobiia bacterium]